MIGTSNAQEWCDFLASHGHNCTLFPEAGPSEPLDSFDVAIDLSHTWSDSAETLADFLRAGKTVITVHDAPFALGIESNPTVQAWIGARDYLNGANAMYTVTTDPILGSIPPGTFVSDCSAAFCGALREIAPGAKVLGAYTEFSDPEPAGILRNIWNGGVSVFLTNFISPGIPLHEEIILNAVNARDLTIPAVGQGGLLVVTALLGLAGYCVIRRRS